MIITDAHAQIHLPDVGKTIKQYITCDGCRVWTLRVWTCLGVEDIWIFIVIKSLETFTYFLIWKFYIYGYIQWFLFRN